jgi:hypothetical protein
VRRAAAAASLVLAVVIVYHNALAAYFFDDDFQWLVGSWSFRPAQLVAFGSLSHFYRPVIDIYFAVMTPLLGGSPVLFHAASIALHAANVLVVFALASRLWGPPSGGPAANLYGFVTALFFAVQPSDIDAIAWVGALAEAIGALFGCLSLLWFLRWREEGESRFRALSVATFALALLTHESSVVFLPVIVLADWLLVRRVQKDPPSATESRVDIAKSGADLSGPRTFAPYIAMTTLYLTIDLWINSRNYVVSQGHYAIGLHMFTNALDYIDALYVGRRDALNYAVIGIGLAALLIRGNARVRFATCWMLLALAPFLMFTWGNTSRYLYQPAIGFSMLLAEFVMQLDRWLRPAAGGDPVGSGFSRTNIRTAILTAVVAAITIRFGIFANANVRDFATRTHVYPEYLARFRNIHGNVPSNTVIASDPRLETTLPYQFVNAAVRWEYRDATIQIAPYESNGVH